MIGKGWAPGKWGLKQIVLLSILPIFVLASGVGLLFNYALAKQGSESLIQDFIQQRRMEMIFMANMPTLKMFIIDIQLGLVEEAEFFRQELTESLERYLAESAVAGSHQFVVVSADGRELLRIVNSHRAAVQTGRLPIEVQAQLQRLPERNNLDLPKIRPASGKAKEEVRDTWPLANPIHAEGIGGLVYQYDVPLADLLAGSRRVLWFNLLNNLIGLAILFGLFYLIIDYHTRPLHRLMEAVQRIMAGDLDQPVILAGYGEARTLSESFEDMRNRLQESFARVRHSNRELTNLLESQRRISAQLAISNNRFEQLAEQSRTFVWELDAEGMFVNVSPLVAAVLGYQPAELVGSLHYYELVESRNQQNAKEDFFRLVDGSEPVENHEKVLLAKNGKHVWLIGWSIPLRAEDGRICGYHGLETDISSRKMVDNKNKKLEAQLIQAQKMESVGRLAGGVAHDFNNMLSVILGYTELILRQLDHDHPFFSFLNEIGKAAKRSADLTQQLLAFARKQTIAPKIIDLNTTVDGMLTMLRRLIGEDIELVWIPGENIRSIRMDPSQIDQILANLCVNARDAIADTGKITIETCNALLDENYCQAHAGAIAGEYIQLTVGDNGCGMDTETRQHLFEPFFTTKEVGKGTGLGLATTYGIVKQNGGFINVYSHSRQGTTFMIYLPVHGTAANLPAVAEVTEALPRGKESILLVEDEPMILDMTTTVLELLGYTVLPAATPGEAIHLAREHAGQIQLLLTDVIMPEMNGRDLAVYLLSLYPSLNSLYMSGYTSDVIAQHGVLDEGVQFIQKPFSSHDIAKKIREILDHPVCTFAA